MDEKKDLLEQVLKNTNPQDRVNQMIEGTSQDEYSKQESNFWNTYYLTPEWETLKTMMQSIPAIIQYTLSKGGFLTLPNIGIPCEEALNQFKQKCLDTVHQMYPDSDWEVSIQPPNYQAKGDQIYHATSEYQLCIYQKEYKRQK